MGLAASELGVCRTRLRQLIVSSKLETVSFSGANFVTVSSILARKAKLREGRKR